MTSRDLPQVRITLPDVAGRLAILKVHSRRLKLAKGVDLRAVAEATAQYSGAELAALANEAAIRAVRRTSDEVTQEDFLSAASSFSAARRRVPSVESLLPAWARGGSTDPEASK